MSRHATIITSLLIAAAPLAAQEFRQEARHEHGKVIVNVALEQDLLSVEIEAPAINVVGFERVPRDAAERQAARAASAWLGSGRALLGVPAAAACRRVESSVSAPEWATGAGTAGKHDHDHDHDHDDGHAHADYRARASFRCGNPAALSWIELWALRQLREVSEVTVNVVTPQMQKSIRTTRADQRIPVR